MPITPDYLLSVGILTDQYEEPIGSGFAAFVHGSPNRSRSYGYIVTAAHVVENEPVVGVKFRRSDGTIVSHAAMDWVPHDVYDVAAAPLPSPEKPVYALPLDQMTIDTMDGHLPQLGTPVYYAGLFDPGKSLSKLAIPVLRSGTLAALYAPVDREPPDKTIDTLHLLDCRSYAGFSGSPCWIQVFYPGPRMDADWLPPYLADLEDVADQIGRMYWVTVLLGVFIEHYTHDDGKGLASNVGMGMVLPIEHVRDLLNKKEFADMRDEDQAKHPDRKRAKREQTSVPREPEFTRDDFLSDLTKVTRREESPEQEG